MQGECPNFVPNLWKPLLCSNCLQSHSLSSSAPPSPAVVRIGRPLHRLQIPPSSPSPCQSHQPARVLEHKRSSSTPPPSTSVSVSSTHTGPLPRRVNINVLTHSESAKRKKDESSGGACDSFIPQRWRPSVCMVFIDILFFFSFFNFLP